MAAVTGDISQAMAYYQEAISLSKQYCFLNEEGICYERFALFKLGLESASEKVISEMFMNSCECYEKWGACEKTKQMKEKYSKFCDFKSAGSNYLSSVDSSSSSTVSLLTNHSLSTCCVPSSNKRSKLS